MKKYLEFKEARDFCRTLGLTTKKQYVEYIKNKNDTNIPLNPDEVYKNDGFNWINFLIDEKTISNLEMYEMIILNLKNSDSFVSYIRDFEKMIKEMYTKSVYDERPVGNVMSDKEKDFLMLSYVAEDFKNHNIVNIVYNREQSLSKVLIGNEEYEKSIELQNYVSVLKKIKQDFSEISNEQFFVLIQKRIIIIE